MSDDVDGSLVQNTFHSAVTEFSIRKRIGSFISGEVKCSNDCIT